MTFGTQEHEEAARFNLFPAVSPTWGHARGDGGGRGPPAPLGGHGRHLDGVGGERRQPRDLVLQRRVGQRAGETRLVPAVHLPGDLVPWGAITHKSGGQSRAGGSSFNSKEHLYNSPETGKFPHLQDLLVVNGGLTCFLLYSILVTFISRKTKLK